MEIRAGSQICKGQPSRTNPASQDSRICVLRNFAFEFGFDTGAKFGFDTGAK